MKFTNLSSLIQFLRQSVLQKETEEYEADDLTITFYDTEIAFQVNWLYDGLIFSLQKDGKVQAIFPEKFADTIPIEELIKYGKMAEVLEENKEMIISNI